MHFCAISCSTLLDKDGLFRSLRPAFGGGCLPSTMALMALLLLLAIQHCAAYTQGDFIKSRPLFVCLASTSPVSSGFPCGACHVEDLMCGMHENTLSTLPGIKSIEDCRAACRDQPQCAFLTYFAAGRFFYFDFAHNHSPWLFTLF